jgi:hypothetical protein
MINAQNHLPDTAIGIGTDSRMRRIGAGARITTVPMDITIIMGEMGMATAILITGT